MTQLRIPGPTPLPPEVLQIMTRQMINHRGAEFHDMLNGITAKLKQLFLTRNDVFLLTGSGTGGMEAVIVNTLSPGDAVLGVSIGVFGDRFINIASSFGARVTPLKFEMGKAADPDAVRKALQSDPQIKAVLVTHNETSTGITNDLAALAKAVKEFDKLLIVDAISSLGCIACPIDEWNLDVVVTGSQKGFMAPPGLAMVSINQKGWQANATAKMPRFYWDFGKAKKYLEINENPWTPCLPAIYAMSVSLDMMLEEGLNNIIARHARVAKAAREGVKALGLTPFADPKYASNTVTAVNLPQGVEYKKMSKMLREEYKVVVSGGQQSLDGKIFRIGHLGWVTEKDIEEVISALKLAIPKVAAQK
ncbi:MAG: alanine--glyoxylate aminotransferase family protein [Dehalococcoidia bacterium]|nr:alanine--glyoxylate aminotransferase family protein [Dehalococcoidia bacterium]